MQMPHPHVWEPLLCISSPQSPPHADLTHLIPQFQFFILTLSSLVSPVGVYLLPILHLLSSFPSPGTLPPPIPHTKDPAFIQGTSTMLVSWECISVSSPRLGQTAITALPAYPQPSSVKYISPVSVWASSLVHRSGAGSVIDTLLLDWIRLHPPE